MKDLKNQTYDILIVNFDNLVSALNATTLISWSLHGEENQGVSDKKTNYVKI